MIPAIRDRLHELADIHGIEELHDLAEATRRKKPQRPPSRREYATLSPTDRVYVRVQYAQGQSMHSLAVEYKTNIGRISEAVNA